MILNKPFLRDAARLSHMDSTGQQNQILTENQQIFFSKNAYDIFLSHSYLDKSLVYTLVDLFNEAGYSVYVDWMVDTQLDRSNVTAKTAATLRERMDACNGLAYISTVNITSSKWCPWELGYMDGSKNGRCAILPIMEKDTYAFNGQEYLGIYPYIDYEKANNSDKYEFWVNDPKDRNMYVSLRKWLLGKEPYAHN